MATSAQLSLADPGDILLVVHDFAARSPDELSLRRGEKVELIEKDDDFGDGWYLGRHLSRNDNGLFPAVYTTPAPKPTPGSSAARRVLARQAHGPVDHGIAELDDTARAPSVQPPGAAVAWPDQPVSKLGVERSYSAPYPMILESNNSPTSGNNTRPSSTSTAHRSVSLSSPAHQNSAVMDQTLSVIEEHITDMSTPRSSHLVPDHSTQIDERDSHSHRLSYVHGTETDEEEEADMLSEAEVRSWSPDRVSDYLEEIGVSAEQCQVMKEQEISGEVLLGMDQGSLMLKEFGLGSIGRRLALWQKIKALQDHVKGVEAPSRATSAQYPSSASSQRGRDRSTSVGPVLPRIPGLMETPQSAPRQTPSSLKLPSTSEAHNGGHSSPTAGASMSGVNQNRRHSSIDQNAISPTSRVPNGSPTVHKHHKQNSFDHAWTMGAEMHRPTSSAGTPLVPLNAAGQLPTPDENGMIVVPSIDLERGYFSGNEAENRDRINKLRKKSGSGPFTLGRAPSEGYGNRRLSGVFRSRRGGSADSAAQYDEQSPTQLFYGKNVGKAQATGEQQARHTSLSPTVTKLEYGNSPSIDAVATSPNAGGSDTSSLEKLNASKGMSLRPRAKGLRAISDAITGDERKRLISSPTAITLNTQSTSKSPLHSPGSSSPSTNSRSLEIDDTSLLKSSAAGSERATPAIPKRRGKKGTSAYTRGLERKGPKDAIIGADYSGWMKKKSSNLMTTWRTRLFILRGTRLSYYYSEDDTEEKGLIDISFHRVLPANNDRMTGLHATMTGASSSPIAPQNAQIQTSAAQDAQKAGAHKGDDSGMFIFKLVPPRSGLSKAVNFTKPTVHYFAVDNVQQGRLWMAALMKATIERDEANQVITTYKEKTISLAKAKQMRQRPAFLEDSVEERKTESRGLNISLHEHDSGIASMAGMPGDGETSFTTVGASDGEHRTGDDLDKSLTFSSTTT